MSSQATHLIQHDVRSSLESNERVVLAVSGGIDSMVLLDAAATSGDPRRLVVATFDHGTGPAARDAYDLVARRCAELSIRFVGERADRVLRTEAELRDARWRFLRRLASDERAMVATAHTESDQIETVLMRVLRGAGARGLAGLYASSNVIRPLLSVRREHVTEYAKTRGVMWVEDPSNASRTFLRNRVRHEILPALRHARPSIEAELLASARAAAEWRRDVEALADGMLGEQQPTKGRVDINAQELSGRSLDELAILWPALAARGGITLDRRGTARVAAFTRASRVGSRIQLAGGWEIIRSRDAFQLRASAEVRREGEREFLAGDRALRWREWSFRPSTEPPRNDAMSAVLPASGTLSVRAWRAGDAMRVRSGAPPRKVKLLLSRAGITGHERMGWPVVLLDDEIVWIPGVRRGDAATARSGRPGLVFVCEYHRR